ncbi:Fc.00g013980.m01.CDS01 [Cosmosporella sp. VM-42]
MKITHLLHVSLWAGFVTGINEVPARPSSRSEAKGNLSSPGSRKFIIEVKSDDHVGRLGRQLHAKTSRNGTYYKQFDCSDIFSGVTIETETDNADTLLQMEGVVNVWQMRSFRKSWVSKTAGFAPTTKLNYSMHQWTGVDRLHAKGIRGKGATVAIVDTGIDYTHKALGGCFGHGCKIAGGYDLVGADWDQYTEKEFPKKPDDDPMDFEGHGTHVAGIIAADNDWLTGVAPDARLLIYKIFSDTPWDSNEETVIQAFCDAYQAGADIISASLGEPDGFSDNPWALVASRLVDKGVVVTTSAGNEGESGPFYASSGGCGPGVLAVAAVNVTGKPHANKADKTNVPRPGYFTTWGPTNELLIKPDIGAPGWDVVSTVLNQSYEALSGTSMSAPYIAGIAALFIGEYGGREVYGPGIAKTIRDRIASSGHSLPWMTTGLLRNFTAPPFQVGTGLVDAWKVLQYDTELGYEPFALMDTELFKPRWKINITNAGETARLYHFKVEPAAGVDILDDYFGVAIEYALVPRKIVPPVILPEPILIEGGATEEVEFVFSLPYVDEDQLPLYSGKVWVISDHGEKLSIPYGGAAYDTEKAFNRIWTFNTKKDVNQYLELTASLKYPCTHLRWDIYEDWWTENSWIYPPNISEYSGYVGSATSMRDAENFWQFDPTINDKDDTVSFPLKRVSRGFQNFWWFGKLANGTQIRPGNYSIRFAALRPYGNPNISTHWDTMYMPVRNIQVLPYNFSNGTLNSTQSFRWNRNQQPQPY